MKYQGIERRSRSRWTTAALPIVVVVAMALAPVFFLAQGVGDRLLVFLTCFPLSGFTYALLWRERRQRILRWATLTFAATVCMWIAVFFTFIFAHRSESLGMALVSASIGINLLLFSLLNASWRRRRMRHTARPELTVV